VAFRLGNTKRSGILATSFVDGRLDSFLDFSGDLFVGKQLLDDSDVTSHACYEERRHAIFSCYSGVDIVIKQLLHDSNVSIRTCHEETRHAFFICFCRVSAIIQKPINDFRVPFLARYEKTRHIIIVHAVYVATFLPDSFGCIKFTIVASIPNRSISVRGLEIDTFRFLFQESIQECSAFNLWRNDCM